MYELIDTYSKGKNQYDDLKEALSTLRTCLPFDDYKIIIFNEDRRCGYLLDFAQSQTQHFHYGQPEGVIFKRAEGSSFLNLLLDEKKIVIYRFEEDGESRYKPLSPSASMELYLPLFTAGNRDLIGCLYLAQEDPLKGDISELLSSKAVSAQLILIQRLFETICNDHLRSSNFLNLLHIFSEVIKTKDRFLKGHCYNVAFLSNLIGREIKLSPGQLQRLYLAAVLHDIGKIYVPEHVLTKEGLFTEDEMREMARHPVHSYNIIKELTARFKVLNGIDKIVLHHHERYDGAGYPDGLKGNEIPLKSRILAVADSVDAMLSGRSYKGPKNIGDTIRDLASNRGKQFDPHLAKAMINILLKKNIDYEDILTGPITTGTLEILTREKTCQLQGTLIKTNFGYKFKPDASECLCEKCKAPLSDIVKATFHTERNRDLYEYTARLAFKTREKIDITRLEPNPTASYFSMVWELEGTLIFKKRPAANIIINRIGGDLLSFYVDEEEFKDATIFEDANKVIIKFENKPIAVTGKIIKTIKVNHKIHCEFKYLNIAEVTRDEIFKQIFKKQTEFTSSLLAQY